MRTTVGSTDGWLPESCTVVNTVKSPDSCVYMFERSSALPPIAGGKYSETRSTRLVTDASSAPWQGIDERSQHVEAGRPNQLQPEEMVKHRAAAVTDPVIAAEGPRGWIHTRKYQLIRGLFRSPRPKPEPRLASGVLRGGRGQPLQVVLGDIQVAAIALVREQIRIEKEIRHRPQAARRLYHSPKLLERLSHLRRDVDRFVLSVVQEQASAISA